MLVKAQVNSQTTNHKLTFVVSFSNVCGVILLRIMRTSEDNRSMGSVKTFLGRATGADDWLRSFRLLPPPVDDGGGGGGSGGWC